MIKGPGTAPGPFSVERETMMKYLLSLWLLGSALSFPLLADEVPDLAARIRYVDNAYGFASRFAVSLRDGAPVRPPVLESSDRDAPGAEDVADP